MSARATATGTRRGFLRGQAGWTFGLALFAAHLALGASLNSTRGVSDRVQSLIDGIIPVPIADQLSSEDIDYAFSHLEWKREPAEEFYRIRCFRMPAWLMETIAQKVTGHKDATVHVFAQSELFDDALLSGFYKKQRLTYGEKEELLALMRQRIFGGEKFAILLPPDSPKKITDLASSTRIEHAASILHELKHYEQYQFNALALYADKRYHDRMEAEAYAFQMRFLMSKNWSREQIIMSYCDTADRPPKEAAKALKAFNKSGHRKFLEKVWREHIANRAKTP